MPNVLLVQADARHMPLQDGSVHMAVCSPPYWGLRNYAGIEPSIWGGHAECLHEWGDTIDVNATNHTDKRRWQHTRNGRDEEQLTEKRVAWLRTTVPQGQFCHHCGAYAGMLGLEPLHDCLAWARGETPCPTCFVCHLRTVFTEVWRVLRPDGTLWLNIGDSMSSGGRVGHGTRQGYKQQTNRGMNGTNDPPRLPQPPGLKPKDLCMVPARLALALQTDGWYLRSDIIWTKPNPMPESVTDRPTKAHEYVFLLSKSERYFYDATAVQENCAPESWHNSDFRRTRNLTLHPTTGMGERNAREATRNLRSVWDIPTSPYSDAHFATYPPALVERCIKAGTSQMGVCPQCGAPYRRLIERQRLLDGHIPVSGTFSRPDQPFRIPPNGVGHYRYTTQTTQHGWAPGCQCDAGAPVPATILDPFAGSGTTGLVARALGRHAVLCDLSYPYLHDQARHRLSLDAMASWEGRNGHRAPEDHTTLPLFTGDA